MDFLYSKFIRIWVVPLCSAVILTTIIIGIQLITGISKSYAEPQSSSETTPLKVKSSKITPSKILEIGVEVIDYSPYYKIENGEYTGFAAQLFEGFAEEYGYELVFKPMPIKRLYESLLSESIDFKFPDHPYWATDLKKDFSVQYSDPVVGFTDGVLVLTENAKLLSHQLRSLGFVRGFTAWPYLEGINSGKIKARELNSLKSLLLLTLNQGVDGAYFNVAVAQTLLKNEFDGHPVLVLAESLPFDRNNYRASSLKASAPFKEFNQYLQSKNVKKLREQFLLPINPE